MSEAKSLVVWTYWRDLSSVDQEFVASEMSKVGVFNRIYEYAHDLSGRFLGVFREVKP